MQLMSYQAEKFRAARRALMLPPKGEAHGIAAAFFEVSLSVRELDPMRLPDEHAREDLRKLQAFMDVSGVKAGHSVESSQWVAKAKTFSVEQKQEIAHAIDHLADWFAANPALP
jgi:hypothetical protein